MTWVLIVVGVYSGLLLPGLTVDVTMKIKPLASREACQNTLHLVKAGSPNLRIKSARCEPQ